MARPFIPRLKPTAFSTGTITWSRTSVAVTALTCWTGKLTKKGSPSYAGNWACAPGGSKDGSTFTVVRLTGAGGTMCGGVPWAANRWHPELVASCCCEQHKNQHQRQGTRKFIGRVHGDLLSDSLLEIPKGSARLNLSCKPGTAG